MRAEANMWPEDVRPYFGDGDEMHMNFHFPLMPRVFMALAQGSRAPIEAVLARTPDLPAVCQWGTFLRCHDELTLEMVTPEERQFMWEFYAPEPRMRLNLGIRRRLAPLLENNLARIKVANSILLTLIGSPIIYYGDEIGMGDNFYLGDRNGCRTPMQWSEQANAGFCNQDAQPWLPVNPDYQKGVNVASQEKDPNSLLQFYRQMIHLRNHTPALIEGEYIPLQPQMRGYLDRALVHGRASR